MYLLQKVHNFGVICSNHQAQLLTKHSNSKASREHNLKYVPSMMHEVNNLSFNNLRKVRQIIWILQKEIYALYRTNNSNSVHEMRKPEFQPEREFGEFIKL